MKRKIDLESLPLKDWKKEATMFQDDYTAGGETSWLLNVAKAENTAVILKQVLEENKFPLYKSENDKLYKKQDGTYRRIKDIYAELAGGE